MREIELLLLVLFVTTAVFDSDCKIHDVGLETHLNGKIMTAYKEYPGQAAARHVDLD